MLDNLFIVDAEFHCALIGMQCISTIRSIQHLTLHYAEKVNKQKADRLYNSVMINKTAFNLKVIAVLYKNYKTTKSGWFFSASDQLSLCELCLALELMPVRSSHKCRQLSNWQST